jgi:hypothetical protein
MDVIGHLTRERPHPGERSSVPAAERILRHGGEPAVKLWSLLRDSIEL